MPKIYNIPPGVPFAAALAGELLRRTEGKPEYLASYRILVPTRRACRTLQESFLHLTGGRPLLLPKMQALGDVDEQELGIVLPHERAIDIPPAIAPFHRRILLGRLIMAVEGFSHTPAHAFALADALGRLLDRVHTENLRLSDLPSIVPEEFASHWQITLRFLNIIAQQWPAVLQERGLIDPADRRNRLISTLAQHWSESPPGTPIIAAGSTGSIPATAKLLKVVSSMEMGMIVLPGLDCEMDEDSWQALDDAHPQATLRQLLSRLEIERKDVGLWQNVQTTSRQELAREMMRPAATADQWKNLRSQKTENIKKQIESLSRIDAATPDEEARVIAIIMREALESPDITATLITPDRTLARSVAAFCRRWNIEIDDSAGQSLIRTPCGIFIMLCIQAIMNDFSPGALLALLRHDLCAPGVRDQADCLEMALLRGPKPPPGIEGLRNRLALADADESTRKTINAFLDRIEKMFRPLLVLESSCSFSDRLDAHIAVCENIAGEKNLWVGTDGEAAALFLSELRIHTADMPEMRNDSYAETLRFFMEPVTIRPPFGAHPRLAILGQLEARMIQSDVVILGSLNEGSWPPDPQADPWMSRPMMETYGLPTPERAVGLAAHDFVQGFCADRVIMTRAKRTDGTPSVPARWLQRLDAVLQAAGIEPDILHRNGAPYLAHARAIDHSPETHPCARPAPTPPLAARPRRLSATKIETWLRDPYGIYARTILGLKKLEPLEKPPDAADRGNMLHDILETFVKQYGEHLPPDAEKILLDIGHDRLSRRTDDPGTWDFWWPRFERIADWFIAHEEKWRTGATPHRTECSGSIAISSGASPFTLTARIDRMDKLRDGSWAIIDYKSGGSFSEKKIRSGESPQLPLEGLILSQGGFPGIPASMPDYLGYWIMTGNADGGNIAAAQGNLGETIDRAQNGMNALVATYDDPAMPYYSVPDPDRPLRFNDYEHLARIQEWIALDDTAEGG